MKVLTQLGMLDINPADVVSIKPAPVLPDNMDYFDLTYCVEFDDRFYSLDDNMAYTSLAPFHLPGCGGQWNYTKPGRNRKENW